MSYAVTSDRLISEPETAEVLGVSPRTVRRLAQREILERVKILGRTGYRASEIEQLVLSGTRGKPRRLA